MTTLQLVARSRPEGTEELSAVPNPSEHEPEWFEDQDTHPALVGTLELVSLAAGLCRNGFRATEVRLTDRYFTTIEGENVSYLQSSLLSLINSGGVRVLERFVLVDLSGIYVDSVKLLDPSNRGFVSLRQEGKIITSPNVRADSLSHFLRAAAEWADEI